MGIVTVSVQPTSIARGFSGLAAFKLTEIPVHL